MDTNVLKTFIAVCEYSGFSAAAKELDIPSLQFLHRLNNWKRNLMSGCLTVIIIKSILRKREF